MLHLKSLLMMQLIIGFLSDKPEREKSMFSLQVGLKFVSSLCFLVALACTQTESYHLS